MPAGPRDGREWMAMAEKMLKFVSLLREPGAKRPASERREDFQEIQEDLPVSNAARQSSRCSQCGVPFCQSGCPLHNAIPDWLALAAEGRLEEAWQLSSQTNNFPEICGRICPQDRLCEGACVLEVSQHGGVTIGAVERFITETAFTNGWVKAVKPRQELVKSVGIIGAGPAGLAAAEELRKLGWQVTVYDRHDRVGGLLVYGIPSFKLEKHVVTRREALLREAGVQFQLNFAVGRDATLTELRHKHDAVLIATGVYKGRALHVPGVGLPGVVAALDYLTTNNRVDLGDTVPAFADGSLNAKDRHVVVIGGGDTAMDCVRTAIRQGAKQVTCLYRRDRQNMPGSAREVQYAEEEGVRFEWLASPLAFHGSERVSAVRANRMRLGTADASGRQAPVVVPDSDFTVQADLVINALGFEPEDLPALFAEPALKVTNYGTLDVQKLRTSLPGVFAAGDIVRGASLVVWAIADGREAAVRIDAYLQDKQLSSQSSIFLPPSDL